MFAYNKAWIALLGPVLMGLCLKVDTNILTPHGWGMGTDFWTAVCALVAGILAHQIPNAIATPKAS